MACRILNSDLRPHILFSIYCSELFIILRYDIIQHFLAYVIIASQRNSAREFDDKNLFILKSQCLHQYKFQQIAKRTLFM